jgi:hypothetical protein
MSPVQARVPVSRIRTWTTHRRPRRMNTPIKRNSYHRCRCRKTGLPSCSAGCLPLTRPRRPSQPPEPNPIQPPPKSSFLPIFLRSSLRVHWTASSLGRGNRPRRAGGVNGALGVTFAMAQAPPLTPPPRRVMRPGTRERRRCGAGANVRRDAGFGQRPAFHSARDTMASRDVRRPVTSVRCVILSVMSRTEPVRTESAVAAGATTGGGQLAL